MQKFAEGGSKQMLFYKSHKIVAVKTLFLEIIISKAILRDLFATVISTITKNDILRFLRETSVRSPCIGAPFVRH